MLEVLSPAKINLGLVVGPKLENAYHYLESIFIAIDICDTMTFQYTNTKANSVKLRSKNNLSYFKENFELVSERGDFSKNILHKIWYTFKDDLDLHGSFQLGLEKQIPTGGGLGGGSSNAASLLKYMLSVSSKEEKPSLEELKIKAAGIGADIPFFLQDKAVLLKGRGEDFKAVNIPQLYGVLAISPLSVSTNDAFISLKRTLQKNKPFENRLSSLKKTSSFLNLNLFDWKEELKKLRKANLAKLNFFNDFEKYVFKTYPVLGDVKKAFYENGASFSLMSGSGASIFALCENEDQSFELLRSVEKLDLNYKGKPVLYKRFKSISK